MALARLGRQSLSLVCHPPPRCTSSVPPQARTAKVPYQQAARFTLVVVESSNAIATSAIFAFPPPRHTTSPAPTTTVGRRPCRIRIRYRSLAGALGHSSFCVLQAFSSLRVLEPQRSNLPALRHLGLCICAIGYLRLQAPPCSTFGHCTSNWCRLDRQPASWGSSRGCQSPSLPVLIRLLCSVPKFFRWLSERYPAISQVIAENRIPEFDCLYVRKLS